MSRKVEVLAFLVLTAVGGCRRTDAERAEPGRAPAPEPKTSPSTERASGDDRVDALAPSPTTAPTTPAVPWANADDLARTHFGETAQRARPIGHTSVVFKVESPTGSKAVFKPASRRGPNRYKGEIAAYRLARALGLVNVPPAYPGSYDRAGLLGALGGGASDAGALLEAEALGKGARVSGAYIPWLDHLEFLPLEAEPLRSRSRATLVKDAPIGATAVLDREGRPTGLDERTLAAQTSALLVFDYLTGNWDRWSGANVGLDRASGTLLFVDNDGAFFETPPRDALARNEALVFAVERFSRSLVAELRSLDRARLGVVMGEETPGRPLLPDPVLDAIDGRRTALLARIDATMSRNGEAATLFFP